MKFKIILCIVMVFSAQNFSWASENLKSTLDDQTAVEVTVYNSNMALVKDVRRIDLGGSGELRFMDVAASIMPETVHVKSLSGEGTLSILEQNYEYDLINETKLLDKYVGKKIKLLKENAYTGTKEEVEALLLSNNNGQIYQIGNEIYLGYPGLRILPELPENLIAKPTLTWLYNTTAKGVQPIEVSYLTNNINWKADYVLILDDKDTEADLSGWVTLDNKSGATYKDAKLKLVAGEVNRVQSNLGGYMDKAYAMGAPRASMESNFQEQSFFEYHLYDLQRPTTIKENQTKQVGLLEANGLKIQKEFVVSGDPNYFYQSYQAQDYKRPVEVFEKFKNSEDNHLGMPLPAGIIRLYKADSDQSLQFIGEDQIKHTPKNEEVRLKLGEAFDVVAERKQTDYRMISNRVHESSWEVTLRNHKKEDITVGVIEPMNLFGDWEVISSSLPYEKQDAFTIRFDVPVAKDQEAKLTYQIRVRY